jgi:osmotically-inducible protein OsmY
MGNQQIAEAVKAALERARLQGKDIALEVKGGVCTLEGQVADAQQKAAATRIVSSVPGVQSVNNQLVVMATAGAPRATGVQQAGYEGASRGGVRPVNHEITQTAAGAARSNEAMAQEIAGALAGAGIQGYDIEVRYTQGVAALVGEVGSAQEASIAQQAAESVPGVNKVLNKLSFPGGSATAQAPQYAAQQFAGPQYGPAMGTPAMPAGYQQPPMAAPNAPMASAGHLVHNAPHVPEHAWPAYAPYDNYAQVTYPSAYDASAWPYIGPFYPYPQVPMEWRSAQLEWDDGHWQLKFHSRSDRWWWFLDPHNWH